MTINLFFVTITISNRNKTIEDYQKDQYVQQLMEKAKQKQIDTYFYQ
ncbi:YrzI family small protein [Bacillus lacus]|uniref:YrzI family small protein n=1 Tax=Metabacillus lacus TaxID=1983721 RepID=A0A7X2LY28_9BACI|nr:YrzI family small protein [Metabacillus lacus]MRX71348.1 YrzI family small protein [Metabacillus lacus]